MDNIEASMTLAIIICIFLSAYFSSTETAFTSLNKIRLKNHVKNGKSGAKLAYEMSEQFDKIISTILIGNNIVNIVSASLATVLFSSIMKGNEAQAITVSTIVMTVAVLIFGEITPKILAKEAPESFAIFSAPILKFFMIVLSPLNYPFTLWKKLISTLFKVKGERALSDEELITMVEEAEEGGELDKEESQLIRSAIEFDEGVAEDIMTARHDIVAIAHSQTMEETKSAFIEYGFSRMPIYDENMDQIVGVINEKDFYKIYFEGATSFENIIKPVYCTSPDAKIDDIFRKLQKNKSHISIVADEYGITVGLLSMEDILEELVGEIWDEHDEVILEYVEKEAGKYSVLCTANLEEFLEKFGKKTHIKEYEDIQTVGGFVTREFGDLPSEGDTVDFENLHIVVTKLEYNRIVEVEVTLQNQDVLSEEI